MPEKCMKLGGTFNLEKLFGNTELNKTERRLCKALADCAFSNTEASVETKTLALLCGVTPRHTRKVMRSLEKKGLIQHEEQFIGSEGRTQTSNKFTFLFNRPGHDDGR